MRECLRGHLRKLRNWGNATPMEYPLIFISSKFDHRRTVDQIFSIVQIQDIFDGKFDSRNRFLWFYRSDFDVGSDFVVAERRKAVKS